jgi:Domain of unknown function (DUF4349)
MGAEAQRELDAIDAALAEGPVAVQYESLARFARELRATRPKADEHFLATLDARVAEGFVRADHNEGRGLAGFHGSPGRVRRLLAGPKRSGIRTRPVLGLALSALLALSVVVPLALLGGRHARQSNPPLPAAVPGVAPKPEAAREPFAGIRGAGSAPRAKSTEKSTAAGAAATSTATPGVPSTGARQVERTASLDIGVAPNAIESAAHQVFTLVSTFNGYVRQSNVSSGGPGQGGASFDLRIPTANLTGAITALSHVGHVRSENDTTNDVTDQFNSLQNSLGDLKAERASLLRQLATTSDPQTRAALKARLQYVEREISQVQGQLGALRARISYTALALSLTAESAAATGQGDLTPGGAAKDAAQILQAALAVIVLGAAALLPLGVLAFGAWMLIRSSRRRLREEALDASR